MAQTVLARFELAGSGSMLKSAFAPVNCPAVSL
jgi:hypothetical protein